MKIRGVASNAAEQMEDRAFVESQMDALLDEMYSRASGSDERFSEMLAHLVAMTVAPALAATNLVFGLPRVNERNRSQRVRLTLEGDPNYAGTLTDIQSDLAESVTNSVLQTLLCPAPRIPASEIDFDSDDICLN